MDSIGKVIHTQASFRLHAGMALVIYLCLLNIRNITCTYMFYDEDRPTGGIDGELLEADAGDVLESEDEDEAINGGMEKEEEE